MPPTTSGLPTSGPGHHPLFGVLCPGDVLHDAPHDPCDLYPTAAIVLVLYNAVFATWAYQAVRRLGYIRLPTSSDTSAPSPDRNNAVNNNNNNKALPGLLTCIRVYLGGIISLLAIELVVTVIAGLVTGVWAGYLLVWNLVALFALGINRAVWNDEVKKTKSFSFMTAGFWLVYFAAESIALTGWMANALSNAISSIAPFDEYLFAAWILRYILLALLVLTAFGVHPLTRTTPARVAAAAAATAAAAARNVETGRPTALGHGGGRGGHHGGGGGGYAPEISNESWLKGASKKIKTLVPFMWPDKRPALQLCVSLALACLVIGRFTVVLVPLQYKIIINSLSVGVFPTKAIFLFVAFRFLQSGFLSNAQSLLWLPVGQYTTRNLSVRMFKHMHSLSLRWHVNRKTGEVLRVLDRGTASIVSLLQMLLFTLFPVIVDITVAIAYFVIEFDVYFGVIVVVTMTSYIFATVVLTEWRTKFRREMIELDNKTSQIGVDSLLNFETVKYYGAEQFEIQRYDKAIANYNKADFKSSGSMQLLNVMQGVITAVGLLVGSLLCAYRVSHKQLSIGDFVLFYQYIIQLYGPLNWMGTMYRVINQNFIDMEKMLKMFEEPLDVKDAPNAKPLVLAGGAVSFNQVQFGYSADQMVLQDLSFEIPAGHTVALVGPSGGGKSTTLKLLFRFFDVLGGSISIDGQDLREVTQTSLRQVIGVVPQDAVLFNDTLMSNIRFARPAATDEEVHAAARAAQIHDKILTFPNGYDTVVGERGLRLSGGERARIAIARTCLKSPSIILLDEATAALDSNTEHLIQEALAELCRGKTTMVIAHRLSTIMAADTICVIKDGTVAEHGTHDQLLALNGLYHELWHKQLRNEASAAAAEGAVAVLEAANVAEDAGATPTVASHPHHGGKGHHH